MNSDRAVNTYQTVNRKTSRNFLSRSNKTTLITKLLTHTVETLEKKREKLIKRWKKISNPS